MARYEFAVLAREKLQAELAAAGIEATVEWDGYFEGGRWRGGTRVWVTTEAAQELVSPVVTAHTATAAEDAASDSRLTTYRQDKQRLRDFMQTSNTSVNLLALVIVVKALVRVLMYKFRELERDGE